MPRSCWSGIEKNRFLHTVYHQIKPPPQNRSPCTARFVHIKSPPPAIQAHGLLLNADRICSMRVPYLCQWIIDAWNSLSKELIIKSFISCGVTNSADGSEDEMISVFKPGRGCEAGLQLLKEKGVNLVDEMNQELDEDEFEELRMMRDSCDVSDDKITDHDDSDDE